MAALERIGVKTDYVRWWDGSQRGDIIHFGGRPTPDYIGFAHGKGCKVVMAELLTGAGSRPRGRLALQKCLTRFSKAFLPKAFTGRMAWDAYQLADACIANTSWEAHLMIYLFNAPAERVHVVPNGVEDAFLNSQPILRGKWLICTATITDRKRVLELAEAAVHAQTPVWIVGKAYSDSDPYAQKFFALVKRHPEIIRYEGVISDRERLAQVYREARGFVLLSTMESRSLSSEEAAACGCPLLLSDLPWARSMFHELASYCPIVSAQQTAKFLKRFYALAPTLPVPPQPASWDDVAGQFKTIYERLLSTSR
ncbi:MAG TPA: glycosyltransferase family 4 protein [Verrucomicrobiae bacterium]